jgi:aspartate kinase
MSVRPVVVKLGGDALSTPERIAAQARRLALRAESGPVVAVVSARRGVTDHLLGLAASIRQHLPAATEEKRRAIAAESDRAVSSGEIVTASLLALALNQLGSEAVSLDAREAGISSRGSFGGAEIHEVAANRIRRLLAQGVIPVVAGFQGWQHGRVATLGRGGTDTTAVAIAAALGAESVVFVKETAGLRTADPKLVPLASRIAHASHAFLTALSAAGAKIIHVDAARLAEHHALPLEFWSLEGDVADTRVERQGPAAALRAVTSAPGEDGTAGLTALAGHPDGLLGEAEHLRAALAHAGVPVLDTQPAANGLRLVVAADQVDAGVRALHSAFIESPRAAHSLRAS